MTAHTFDRKWTILRRRFRDGGIGGPNDGADDGGDHWQVEYECAHGETITYGPIGTFVDLIALMTVATYKHRQALGCRCDDPDDKEIVAEAIRTWREAFGAAPVVDMAGWEGLW
jgi:hypothetical protein